MSGMNDVVVRGFKTFGGRVTILLLHWPLKLESNGVIMMLLFAFYFMRPSASRNVGSNKVAQLAVS